MNTLSASITTINTLTHAVAADSTLSMPAQTLRVTNITVNAVGRGLTIGAHANEGTLTSALTHLTLANRGTSSLTVNAVVADHGSPGTVIASGTVVLAGDNTYSGGTSASGTLQIGAGGTTGTPGTGPVTAAALRIYRSDVTVSNTITCDALTIATGGTITMAGTSSVSGTLTTSDAAGTVVITGVMTCAAARLEGVLAVGNGGTSGALSATTIALTGTLTFNHSDAVTCSAAITGTGSVTQAGSGVTTLSGTNSHSGATVIAAGTLSIGSDANVGASSIQFKGGVLRITGTSLTSLSHAPVFTSGYPVNVEVYDAGNTFTIGYVMNQGLGGLTKTGAGTLVLSGTNTYTGTTTLTAGTLSISTAANLSSSGSLVFNGGTLRITGGAVTTWPCTPAFVSGMGVSIYLDSVTFVQSPVAMAQGTGGFTLAGSGRFEAYTSTFTGAITVNGGTLSIGVWGLSSAVTINAGGTMAFSEDNSTGGITVASAGTLQASEGAFTRIVTVGGGLSLESGAIIAVRFNSSTPSVDLVAVSTALTIATGAILRVSDIGLSPELVYGIPADVITYATWNGGTFVSLPDGTYFRTGGRHYQISYSPAVTITMLEVAGPGEVDLDA